MTLTTKQLDSLYSLAWIAHDGLPDGEGRENRTALLAAVCMELNRREHGPFTLAEAVASGRPFRRKAWAPLSWARISEHVYNGGALIVFVVGGRAIPVGPNDITATDYELMPEGASDDTKPR